MNNLSLREKAALYLLLLVIIGLAAYIFGIRTLNSAYAEMQAQLITLQQRKEYLDQLKQNNIDAENQIEQVKNDIIEIERTFISDLKTENIEQFVLKTMENSGIGFMNSINVSDVGMPGVTLADGTPSNDTIVCKSVDIEYASTDGYEITQFNTTPSLTTETGAVDPVVIEDILNRTGIYDPANHFGYDEFLAGLRSLANADPDCIKVASLDVSSTSGYLTLKASIEFYSANLTNRISTENKTQGYAVWKGDTNVNTDGGFIGVPYYIVNPDSAWNGVLIDPAKISGFQSRPFASYLSNAYFTQLLAERGVEGLVGPGRTVVAAAETETAEQ